MSLDLSSTFPQFSIPMSERGEHGIYTFDHFRLDVGKLMLYRGDAEVSLPPKVIKTLAVLVEGRGSIISKDELIDRVWPDAIVEEASLSQHLYLLRKTLGSHPDGRPYIETLRRRGYRFNGDAQLVTEETGRPPARIAAQAAAVSVEPTETAPISVERHGNVLRLVDWNNASQSTPGSPAIESTVVTQPPFPSAFAWLSASVVCIAAAAAVIAYWIWPTPALRDAHAASELTIVRLTNGSFPVDATIAPEGDYFVYHETAGDMSQLWLQQVGQANRIEIGRSLDHLYGAKTFSPDGRFVYYVAIDRSTGNGSLYRVAATGGPAKKLIDGIVGPVSFSPEGDEIVFLRSTEKTTSSLVIADRDGRSERIALTVRYPNRIVGSPAWSPDGELIAFGQANLGDNKLSGAVSVLGLELKSGGVRPLSNEKWDTVYRIAWTFDGRGLATVATRNREGRTPFRDQVYYISYPAGASRRLTNEGNRHYPWGLGVTKSNALIATPFNRSSQIWSLDPNEPGGAVQISYGHADGRAGLSLLPDGRIGYIAQTGTDLNVWSMNPDGSDAKQLTGDPRIVEELRVDPQGRYFVFAGESEDGSHLFRVDADGRNLRQLTFGDGNEGDSTISPDGNWIVYATFVLKGESERAELWRVSINGGEPTKFSDELCAAPSYSPAGDLVSCIRDEKEILVLSAKDGRKIESYQLPAAAAANYGTGWTADGSGLTYLRFEKNVSNIWLQPRNNRPARKLTHFTSGIVMRYTFAPDDSRLYVARGFPQGEVLLIKNFR